MRMLKLLSLVFAVGLGTSATAADYTLTVSSWAPPTHGVNATLWPNLIKMMETRPAAGSPRRSSTASARPPRRWISS